MLHVERKIRSVIEDISKQRLKQNILEHNRACRLETNYRGDIIWNEHGVTHRIAQGPISFDGAGLTRAYGHKMKGGQAVFIVFSLLTGKPIMVVHYQVSAGHDSQLYYYYLLTYLPSNTLSLLCSFADQMHSLY